MRLAPGDVVDRFEVVDLLGAGGIAEVYRVRHRVLGSIQALKVVTAGGTGVARRLVREGSIQAQLRHPNIVAVTDVIEVAGCTALVMEYVEGITLERLLAEGDGFTVDAALALFAHVLAGVAAAHDAGVLHRDLKPGNVLLSPGATGVTGKVADFGLAKVLVDEPGPKDTLHGLMMGTPGYMAPEQIGDAGGADARADVYALGAILYEMLAGVPVFPREAVTRILQATLRGELVPLEDRMPDLSLRIARTVDRCLALERDDRYPDATAIAAELYADRPDLKEVVTGARVGMPVPLDLPDGVRAPSITGSFRTPMVQSSAANPTIGPDAFSAPSTIAPPPAAPRAAVGTETRVQPPSRTPSRRWLMSGFGLFAAAMLVVFLAPKLAPRADRAALPEDEPVAMAVPAPSMPSAPSMPTASAPAEPMVAAAPLDAAVAPATPAPQAARPSAPSGTTGGAPAASKGTVALDEGTTTPVVSRADDTLVTEVAAPPPAPPAATVAAVSVEAATSPGTAPAFDAAALVGTWRGTWSGRPLTLTLSEAGPGRLSAKLEVLVGSYRTFNLEGPVDASGRFSLAEATTPGWWLDGTLSGGVLSGNLARPEQDGKTAWTAKKK